MPATKTTVFALLICLHGVASSRLLSPIHSHRADAPEQNSVQRGSYTWIDEWTPGAVNDYHIMAYDRRGGGVVGYDVSSGRVFSQGQSADQFQPPPMHLPAAYIINFGMRQDQAECDVLSRGTTDTDQLMWRNTDMSHAAISQLFTVRAESGWSDAMLSLQITSNSDSDFCCKCRVARVPGPFRSTVLRQMATRQGNGCVVCPKILPMSSDGELPDYHHGMEPVVAGTKHRMFCSGVEDRLQEARSFLVVTRAWWREAKGMCATKANFGLRYMQTIGGQARARRIDERPSQPRAVVLVDLKLSAQAIDSADLALGHLCTLLESVLILSKQISTRNSTGLSHLHKHEQTTLGQRQRQQEAEASTQSPDSLQLPLSFNRTCDGPYVPLVKQFLESAGTAFTSEQVNTTAVAVAVGRHVLQCAQCLVAQLEAIAVSTGCMLAVVGGVEATLDQQTVDTSHGTLTLASDAMAVQAAINALQVALAKKHHNAALDSGQTEDEMADDIVQCTTDATHALLRRVSATSSSLTGFMHTWQETFHGNLSSAQRDIAEDTWCCGTLRHTPFVSDNRYPPCLPHQLRLVRREMDRYLQQTRNYTASPPPQS